MEKQNFNYFQKSFLKEYLNYKNKDNLVKAEFERITNKMLEQLKPQDKETLNFYMGCYLTQVINLIADCPYLAITFNNFNGKLNLNEKINVIFSK